MNAFELERLRREGKNVILPGGRVALVVAEEQAFEIADKNIDAFYARKKRLQMTEEERLDLIDLEDAHGLMPTIHLGC